MPTYTIKTLDDARQAQSDGLVVKDAEFDMENPRGMIFALRVARNNADLPKAWRAVQATGVLKRIVYDGVDISQYRYNQWKRYFYDMAEEPVEPMVPNGGIEIALAGFIIVGGGVPNKDYY